MPRRASMTRAASGRAARAISTISTVALAGALAVAVGGCESPAVPRATFPVTFIARADEPLAGVAISIDGDHRLGTTGADGILRATLSGPEGAAVPFRVTCPDGYRAPREMPILTLRRFVGLDPASAARGIQVSIECNPAQRMAALVVRAGQPDLPVLARGREVARTGPDGVAHALLALPPDTTFRVVLDTSTRPKLHPESPATTLALADTDEIFVIDQRFEVDQPPPEAPPQPRRRHRRKKPVEPPPPATEPPPPVHNTVPEPLK
ncbi:MAG TPA: hypothetical protein VK698_09675 [Kofleriaceae bacterium]|nr:hypothetical protein [Kofleriaceae bacterium]